MKLIKKQNRFILVSDEEIKEGDWYFWNGNNNNDPSLCVDSNNYNAIKENNDTVFYKVVAGISELPEIDFSVLREEDCKEIGWVDVENLWLHFNKNHNNHIAMGKSQFFRAYEYITAQSLNDKMFSLEGIRISINMARTLIEGKNEFDVENILGSSDGTYGIKEKYSEKGIIQSLLQTEWNVVVNENNQVIKILK